MRNSYCRPALCIVDQKRFRRVIPQSDAGTGVKLSPCWCVHRQPLTRKSTKAKSEPG